MVLLQAIMKGQNPNTKVYDQDSTVKHSTLWAGGQWNCSTDMHKELI